MRFVSTRGHAAPASLDDAIAAGLAPDGGLYLPERIATVDGDRIALPPPSDDLAPTAAALLAPYFAGSRLRDALPAICAAAFDFPTPLRPQRGDGDHLLELFHGPTAAFKDVGARFLAEVMARLRGADDPDITILVATSGDTGAAVGAAFHRRPGFRVVILYPDGRVSPRQAHGLGCFGDNVRALRVAGSFDDCQRLVKQALADADLRARAPLGSANSISLGRLLPQAAYYAHSARAHEAAHGGPLNYVVPTGNLGNALACWLARAMGLPIGDIVLASNANDVLPRYFAGADYAPQPSVATLANAMDVGAPSNFERLRAWHASDDAVRAAMRAVAVDDAAIADAIRTAPAHHGVVPCPHTAVGLHVLDALRAAGDARPWAVVATAHPAKFDTIVEPLVGHAVTPPAPLAAQLARPAHAEPMAVDYDALRALLLD
ncbi:threonine synthase [Cognatilysobacter tabacisoli]|uniref:threonine synthase n=1 Tax=Cognatilysobacter tabacisoli TaxID=2315424 RepID=UPI000E6AEFC0|nr:threonine synthase [Lysobacter tabacisoli]